MKGFYIIFYHYDGNYIPPGTINLEVGGVPKKLGTLSSVTHPRLIPGAARRAANWVWGGPDYIPPPINVAGLAAYKVISPTIAWLAWSKPKSGERGVWSKWHGNPWK